MTPLLLRQIWKTVTTSSAELAVLSNSEMAQAIMNQIASDMTLSSQESQVMHSYLCKKASLIRDLIESGGFGEL